MAHVHCAGSLRVLPALGGAPVLAHLHELSVGLDLHMGPLARRQAGRARDYLAVSRGVADEFATRYRVERDRIGVQPGFLDPTRLAAVPVRAEIGLPDDALVVVASGVRHWRKAPELFVRAALLARTVAPEVPWRFVWVGGTDDAGLGDLVDGAGLDDVVQLLPHQPEALRWVAAADIFLLPAREDAFPLVCVEAAAAGVPIVAFDNGGAAELVAEAGCGRVAAFPDVGALVAELVSLARDPEARTAAGQAGAAHAAAHLTVEVAGPRLAAALARTARAGSAA